MKACRCRLQLFREQVIDCMSDYEPSDMSLTIFISSKNSRLFIINTHRREEKYKAKCDASTALNNEIASFSAKQTYLSKFSKHEFEEGRELENCIKENVDETSEITFKISVVNI